MEQEKISEAQKWLKSALMGAAMGVLPVAALLTAYFIYHAPDALIWPEFTPPPVVFVTLWACVGVSASVSVALCHFKYAQLPRRMLMLWTVRAFLIPAWLLPLPFLPALSFVLLLCLVLSAAYAVRTARGASWPAALTACPLVLWGLTLLSVLYVVLLGTP